ncbi:MAG: YihY family inner membrane protein [Pseudomonadota bacterium]
MTLSFAPADWRARFGELGDTLQTWPWLETARTLRERFREDKLGLTASSLTFTTLIALVPLVTVMLAVFSAFPMFSSFQGALEKYFLQSLVPDGIAKPVLAALTQFASKATRLGTLGLVVLVFTALALMLTIDRALNAIWRVRRPRSIAQRVLVYWAALTLGPLLLGISLSLTATAITASKGVIGALPGGVGLLLNVIEFLLLAAGMAGLYHYVPNTQVRWRHAMAGGVFVAAGIELAKGGLAWYVRAMPTYSTVYGAFATVPILLLWVYVGWVIVLWGAVIAAYAPSLSMRITRLPATPGHRFSLALALIAELARAKQRPPHGSTLPELAAALSTDPLQVETGIEALQAIGWVARLDEEGGQRLVLLVDPQSTPARPLIDEMLLQPSAASRLFRERTGIERVTLGELI